jgi:hypothetical protein
MAKKKGKEKGGVHKALNHPVRAAILLVLQRDGYSSPKRFSTSTQGTSNEVDLNLAAYHFRVLHQHEAIELLDEIQKRGATEHLYGINPKSPILDSLRTTLLLERLMANDEKSVGGLSLNGGPNDIAILPIEVDDEGRSEIGQMLTGMKATLAAIAELCRQRLTESEQASVTMRIGIASYMPVTYSPEASRRTGTS